MTKSSGVCMTLRMKVTALIMGIIFLTSAATAYVIYQAQATLIETSKNRELNIVALLVQSTLQDRAEEALAKSSLIGNIPAVRSAFRSGDRDALMEQLHPTVTFQRENYGLTQASFWNPPASSFLVLFDSSRAVGEDVSHYREILTTASRRQEAQKGIEIGRSGPALRGVFPVKDEQGFIGIIDIATDFSALAAEVKQSTGYEVGIFIHNELMEKTAVNVARPESQYIIGGLRSIQSTNWKDIKAVASPELLSYTADIHFATVATPAGSYGWVSVPLADFAGRPIGAVVATRSFNQFQRQANQALALALFVAVLQAVLLTATILVLVRVMILRPVRHVQTCLHSLVKDGDTAVDSTLTERGDEIGQIARSLQELRDKMVSEK